MIRGGRGHDTIFGDDGADFLCGGPGNDYLWGAGYYSTDTHSDYILGGSGYDQYGIRNRYAGRNDRLTGIEEDLKDTV